MGRLTAPLVAATGVVYIIYFTSAFPDIFIQPGEGTTYLRKEPEDLNHCYQCAYRCVGSLGNIEAAADGTATLTLTDPLVQLIGEFSVIGSCAVSAIIYVVYNIVVNNDAHQFA